MNTATTTRRRWCFPSPAVCLVIVAMGARLFAADNGRGWQLLLENKPVEALTAFLPGAQEKEPRIARDALFGLALSSEYLGRDVDASRYFFKSCLINPASPAEIFAGTSFLFAFSRDPRGYLVKEGYTFLRRSAGEPHLFSGELIEALIERNIADGKVRQAKKLGPKLGAVRTWQCIGPFENISNSGYHTEYPPEKEIDFSRSYLGKNGTEARWFPITVNEHTGWLFMDQHSASRNAVYYFYCTVESRNEATARLAFGASGAFTVYLNTNPVLADSVFRNTGIDIFMQSVTLHKGANTLLVKIGHYDGVSSAGGAVMSNFLLRFLGENYAPVEGLRFSTTAAKAPPGGGRPADLRPMPLVDSCARYLRQKIETDPGDHKSALLLIKLFNITEMTDSSQVLCEQYLKRFPNSALVRQLYAESLARSRKRTQSETEMKTSYRLSPLNFSAWSAELSRTAESGGAQKLREFLNHSPPEFRKNPSAVHYELANAIAQENRAEIYDALAAIEQRFPFDYRAVSTAAAIFARSGLSTRAERLIRGYLGHDRGKSQLYRSLINLTVKEGEVKKLRRITRESLRYRPDDVNASYTAALLMYANKRYDEALRYTDACLRMMPTSSNALNLKGNILSSLGRDGDAKRVFEETIKLTNDAFNAWENIRRIENKPGLDSLAPLPSVDSLLSAARSWNRLQAENGAILSFISDIYIYPSRCSRERTFIAVYLGTQKAIDTWKEYPIGFNPYYQTGNVFRAFSRGADGAETPADIGDDEVVFKSLKPGDCIVLEYGIRNYYGGFLAKQVYGRESFQLGYPVFDRRLRFIMPSGDTIPYRVYGDSLEIRTAVRGDYRITAVRGAAETAMSDESFMAGAWPGKREVSYSTIPDWRSIVTWYRDLTCHSTDNSLELGALADSLFRDAADPLERARRVHDYIVSNIRYSHVPFRQSGLIPQNAHDVLTTRIGDCKDMSSLAKHLLNRAGIPAEMVLVNTGTRHYLGHAYPGPDFNHCIVSYAIDGARSFMDCTDADLSFGLLPKADQGAMALIIDDESSGIVTLPVDSAGARIVRRDSEMQLDSLLTLSCRIATYRKGNHASGLRELYRFLSDDQRKKEMHKALSGDYPRLVIDSLSFSGLSPESDSLLYRYAFTAKNAATINGGTATVPLHFPDKVETFDFPYEEQRTAPVDMAYSRFDIGTFTLSGRISYPPAWKPITLPSPLSITSPWGSYSLEFSQSGNTISYTRTARFSFYQSVGADFYESMKSFMMRIRQADETQLLFFVK